MKPRFFRAIAASSLRKTFHTGVRQGAAVFATIATISAAGSLDAATITYGGTTTGDIGVGTSWVGGVVPSVSVPDTAQWDGSIAGNLVLTHSTTAFAGAAGNAGVNLSLTSGQTSPVSIDTGTNTSSFRMNGLTIASGAGAFTFGDGANVTNVTLGGAAGTHTWTNDSSNVATISSDVVWGLGGGGAHTLAVGGTGSWIFNNAAGGGALTIAKSGSGSLTLNGANTHTGGTTISAGTLNVNHASALSNVTTGNLTITGGTIDNTSAAAITTTAAKASLWNGDFTFTGTKDLSLNGGGATIGGTAGVRTLTVSAGKFSTGIITAPAGFSLTKAGAGTYVMSSTANTSNIAGTLNITGGLVQTMGDMTVGGLTGSGTFENGGTAAKWFFLNNAADNVFSGSFRDGTSARIGLVKSGAGKLDLTGTSNSSGDRFDLQNGIIRITGSYTAGYTAGGANQTARIGSGANVNGQLIVDGGTFNAAVNVNPSIAVAPAANARGFIKMTSGSITSVNELHIGNGNGAAGTNPYAALTMSGGTLTSGSWLVVAANNDNAVLNQSGGSLVVSNNRMTIGAGGAGSVGVVNLSGGTFSDPAGIFVGENGTGTLNVSGTSAASMGNLQFAGNGTSVAGTVNLLGGTLSTGSITKGTGTGTYLMNFNGGLLKATAGGTNFFADLANTSAYVYGGGARIDSNGFDVGVGEALLAPATGGVTGIASFTPGAGYVDTPVVTITRGAGDTTGVGATAVANVSGGVVTGITITNPGTGYTAVPVFTLSGGGATTAATVTGATPTANTSGGLTKSGNGTLTLGGASTYAGATSINGGTLLLSASGSINGSSGVSITNASKLIQASSTALSAPVTLTSGTVDGTGTINSLSVASSAGNNLRNGNGTAGAALTVNSLTFDDAAVVDVSLNSTAAGIVTTNLTTGAANSTGKITVNASNASWLPGTYDLISYTGSIGGVGFSEFQKGTITGLSGRQSAALTDTGSAVALTISGDNPAWTGAQSNEWSTAAIAGSKNWSLITSGTPTDFVAGDIVLFDDGGSANPAVNITANVAPLTTTFNNSSVDYSISSTGGFGITSGSVILNGTGKVALNNANTYAGGTVVNAGTLQINNASAIGTGPLSLAAFTTIDNTSGSPVTLTTNNAQNWNGDFIFEGTNNLDLGTGAVTLSANRSISVLNSTLAVGGAIGGTGFSLTKTDPGTLALYGTNTYTGVTQVKGGTLAVTGGTTGVIGTNIEISPDTIGNGTLSVSGGTVNSLRMIIGGNSGNIGAPGSGTLLQSGGVINTAQWFTVGSGVGAAASTASGSFTMTGGTLNASTVGTQNMEVANFAGTTGTITMSGSSAINLHNNASIALGANNNAGSGSFTQGGGTVTLYSNGGVTAGGTGALRLGAAGTLPATSSYTYNLNGGTLNVPSVTRNAGAGNLSSGIFNFNGGTLKAPAANATFLQGLTSANVLAGGAKIDDGGFSITVAQPLLSGISGDGGLTKSGSGTLSLTGVSTYTGATTVNAGTLSLTGAGEVNGSSGISLNGGSKLLQLSSAAVTSPVTISNGTVDGTGTLASVSVASGAGNVVANGNGAATALTIGSLSFSDAGTLNLKVNSTAPALITTSLNSGTAGGGQITVNASNTAWVNGTTYNLVGYSSLGGGGFSEFVKGTITGLTPRQTATLVNVSGNIALSVVGDDPVWTGAASSEWSTATIASPKNWVLPSGPTETDFLNTDNVIFNDAASGSTSVVIATGGVSPNTTTFSNSTKNYTFSSGGAVGIANGTVVKNGTGAVSLGNANTYTGGTTVNNGTLNLNNASAIGTGALTLNGGAIGNTSTAPITLATNNVQNWNGDFSFTGPDNLNMGTGAVTLGGAGTARTVTVTAGTLTANAIPVATPGYGLTKAGSGTLAFGGTAASTIAGTLTVNAGTLQIGTQDFTATGLAGSGIVQNGSGTTRWLYLNMATDSTFSGVLENGAGAGNLGLNKSGVGTLTLTGANTYNDQTTVNQGKLVFSGTTNNTRTANVVGTTAGQNAILELTSGSTFGNGYNGGQVYNSSLNVSTNATSVGVVRVVNGSTLTANRQIAVGPTGFGAYSQTGGTTTLGGFIATGGTANGGVLNLTGGSFTLSAAPGTIGYGATTSIGVLNLGGTATFSANGAAGNGLWLGEVGTGILNLTGSALLSIPNDGIVLGKANAAGNGIVNLRGGTAQVASVSKGTGSGTFNFHGGLLKANVASTTFMQGLTAANVYSGGAAIDTNGFAVTIAQPLLAPADFGVSTSGLTVSGGGYIDTPIVTITGGGGTGATAVASIDGSGNLTGITITNPGTGYTSAPTFALVGGGIGNTGAVTGVATLVQNVSGGLTKSGTGTLTLSGANTYTGNTSVNAGTLAITSSYLADAADVSIAVGASMALNYSGTDTIDELTIDGVAKSPGTYGATGSGATNIDDVHFSGTGTLTVTTGPAASAYASWATAKGLDDSDAAHSSAKSADPDGDGKNNLYEFAFDGNPLSGVEDGKIVGKVATVGSDQVLTLTLPVRTGATFSGTPAKVSALIDGITYRVEGGTDLTNYTDTISEVTGGDASTIQTGLPTLSTGWTYRTFRVSGTVAGVPTDFIRAKVGE